MWPVGPTHTVHRIVSLVTHMLRNAEGWSRMLLHISTTFCFKLRNVLCILSIFIARVRKQPSLLVIGPAARRPRSRGAWKPPGRAGSHAAIGPQGTARAFGWAIVHTQVRFALETNRVGKEIFTCTILSIYICYPEEMEAL